jgi:hypothetical protein
MGITNCRGCGQPLTSENDSEAHVFPNALGGRLKPRRILCRTCNIRLDRLADNPLVKAFGDWPTLLNFPRDHGEHPPRLIETREGRRVRLEADGSLELAEVIYDVTQVAQGHKIEIGAGNMKTFRQLLKRAKKQFPQFDAKAAEQYARVVGIDDGDELKLSLNFSPQAVFGGVITAIWLYLILTTGRAFMEWDRLLDCITPMQRHGGTFRYLVNGLPALRGPDIDLGHKIVIRSVPATGELIAYVEILGILRVGGIFARAPAPSMALEQIYAYDLASQKDRSAEFSIEKGEFERQQWQTVGLGPTEYQALRKHFKGALNVFVTYYRQRFRTQS